MAFFARPGRGENSKWRWWFNRGGGNASEPSDGVGEVSKIIEMGVLRTDMLRNSEKTSLVEVLSDRQTWRSLPEQEYNGLGRILKNLLPF